MCPQVSPRWALRIVSGVTPQTFEISLYEYPSARQALISAMSDALSLLDPFRSPRASRLPRSVRTGWRRGVVPGVVLVSGEVVGWCTPGAGTASAPETLAPPVLGVLLEVLASLEPPVPLVSPEVLAALMQAAPALLAVSTGTGQPSCSPHTLCGPGSRLSPDCSVCNPVADSRSNGYSFA